jgi:hypothetical protein
LPAGFALQDGISIASTFNGAAFGTPAQHAAGQIRSVKPSFWSIITACAERAPERLARAPE